MAWGDTLGLLKELRPPARALVLAVIVLGAAALVARILTAGAWTGGDVLVCALLTVLLVASDRLRVDLPTRRWLTDYSFDEVVWVAGLLLVRPSVLLVATVVGLTIAQAARGLNPLKVAFNVAQSVLVLAAAEVVFETLGAPPPDEPAAWLAVGAAMAVLWLLNTLLMGLFVSLLERRPLLRAAFVPTGALVAAGNLAIGVLAALIIDVQPVALPLLLVPFGLTWLAYRGWIDTARERDHMRDMAEDAAEMAAAGRLEARLAVPGGTGGAAVLARTLNDLLARVQGALQRERRFIRETSHELRTPITISRGHLEVMAPDPSPVELKETVAVVVDELDRMTRIVEDMSTLARMEDPGALRSERVEVERLVADVAVKAMPLLEDRLVVELGVDGAELHGDRQRLTQALINLLKNARDHTPAGTPVRLRVVPHADGWLFEVTDEGGGLPPGEEQRVFEPFHAGDRSAGSGLGLAIVSGIARAHGGAAGVENRPGAGATFWVRVPA